MREDVSVTGWSVAEPSLGAQTLAALSLRRLRSPWQLAAAWVLLASVVLWAHGSWPAESVQRLLLALLLVDPVWGGIWDSLMLWQVTPAGTARADHVAPGLPYAVPEAPFTRLWALFRTDGDAAARPGPAAALGLLLILGGTLAWLLGPLALLMTAVVLLLALTGLAAAPAFPGATRHVGGCGRCGLALGHGRLCAGGHDASLARGRQHRLLVVACYCHGHGFCQ